MVIVLLFVVERAISTGRDTSGFAKPSFLLNKEKNRGGVNSNERKGTPSESMKCPVSASKSDLNGSYIHCGRTFLSLLHIKGHTVAFIERLEPA